MARYTSSYIAKAPLEEIQTSLAKILQSHNFNIIYQKGDYMMAREVPGGVSLAKLVTVEVLVDSTHARDEDVQVNLVVKNEELALQKGNHCSRLFDIIQSALAKIPDWQLI